VATKQHVMASDAASEGKPSTLQSVQSSVLARIDHLMVDVE